MKTTSYVLIQVVLRRMLPTWRTAMTQDIKLPRKLSDEPKAPKPRRLSHEKVIDNIERWANSSGLQPPILPDRKTA
jgi:hypothetical protein